MEASAWGRRLVGAPRSALVIPDYSSLAQLKGAAQAGQGSKPASAPVAPQTAPAAAVPSEVHAADDELLPKQRGSARPSTIDLVPNTPAAPTRATGLAVARAVSASSVNAMGRMPSAERATPVFDVEVDLPEAVFPVRSEAVAPEAGAAEAEPETATTAVMASNDLVHEAPIVLPAASPEETHAADLAPDAPVEPVAQPESYPALQPALAQWLAEMIFSELYFAAAIPLYEAPVAPEQSQQADDGLLAQMLLAELHFTRAIALPAQPAADAETVAPAAAAPTTPHHALQLAPRTRYLGPTLLASAALRLSAAWLRPVPGVVLPALVNVDARDAVAPAEDGDARFSFNGLALPAGSVVELSTWDAGGDLVAAPTPRRALAPLAPYAFVGAAALALAAILLRPGMTDAPAQQNEAAASGAIVAVGPTAVPSPTGLAGSLAVVNPANRPTASPVAELAVLASSMAGRAAVGMSQGISGTLGSVFPFNIDIVTPTPNSAAEQLLFRDPLVAAEPAAGAPVALAPESQSPVSLEQPVIVPALESERNGGAAVAARPLEELARPRILPAMSVVQFPDIATPIPTAPPEPTAAPIVLAPGRVWSSFTPSVESHFWVERPHPAFVQNQIAAPSYQFGSTGGGRYRPHHGMDIANAYGTPVRAATTGEVVHAGLDDPDVLGPYPNFYGNAVVIRLDKRLAVAGGEMDVYLLYGHLSEVTVQKGQRVQPDDIVGMVGMTGIAIGPHLHVEMRVGANTYEASVNPYLWVQPPPGDGAVAVRLLTADGRTWPNARVTLARFEGNLATWARVLEAYPDNESINPDPSFGETTAMDAVPAGVYYAVAVVNGERVAAEVTVEAGKTTCAEMRTQQ